MTSLHTEGPASNTPPETDPEPVTTDRERKVDTGKDTGSEIVSEALTMWREGICPVRLKAHSKAATGNSWPTLQYADEAAVRKAFRLPSNLGMRLGNGIADVDLDTPEAVAAGEYLLPATPVEFGKKSTPRAHKVYRLRGGGDAAYVQHLGAPVGKKSPTLVELRADPGHQTMVPPSDHPDEGTEVRYTGAGRPWDAPEVDEGTLVAAVASVAVVAALAPYWPGKGSRHHAHLALAGALLRDTDDDRYTDKVTSMLHTLAAITGDDEAGQRADEAVPSTRAKLRDGAEVTGWTTLREYLDAPAPEKVTAAAQKAAAALREAMGVPPEGGDPLAGITRLDDQELLADQPDDWGDAGLFLQHRIAARFARIAEGKCLYVHGTGWHWWDGSRWALDHGEVHAHRLLKALLRSSMAAALTDPGLLAAIKSASSAAGTRGVLALAAKEPGLWTDKVDADAHLLNCRNGTLDLNTLELRPADPADRITKVTAADYKPGAAGPEWNRLLRESLPDPEVRAYLQRYVGLSLLGRVEEHLLVFAYGKDGRNGKGVTTYTIQKALGDYGVTATSDLLVKKGHSKSAGDYAAIMQLRGARWAVMSELDKGTRLDVGALKSISGGDMQSAKGMGKDFVNFEPSHMLIMLTNHLPVLSSDEAAAWARVRVIPYEVSFTGREDTRLTFRLQSEYEAVLAWAVEGLRAYQERGMDDPLPVREATADYRRSNDVFARFLDARCELVKGGKVRSSELHQAYDDWAMHHRLPPMGDTEWSDFVEGEGLAAYRLTFTKPGNKKTINGLRIRSDRDPFG